MSVYSGFATRQQQHKYNSLLETLVIALKKRVIKFYAGEPADEDKFKLLIKKVYKKMLLLEKGKYMAPKYSSCFSDLIDTLQIEINYDTLSQCSSMMSQTFSLRRESLDPDPQALKSNALLSTKKNLLEAKANKIFNSSTFSLSKAHNVLPQPMDHEFKEDLIPRSTSLEPTQGKKPRFGNRGKLEDLKNLRGTMNMPKVQDFLPKKQPIKPVTPPRRNTFLQRQQPPQQTQTIAQDSPKQSKVVFRRQKYSRADVKAQDV